MTSYDAMTNEELEAELVKLESERIAHDTLQNALKISANSCYGVTASPHCMWYDPDIGEAITVSGKYTVLNAAKAINEYFRGVLKAPDTKEYVVYMDTDSVYLTIEDLVRKVCPDASYEDKIAFVLKVGEKAISPLLDETFKQQSRNTNCDSVRVSMKSELVCDRSVFLKSKRYINHVCIKEGGIRLDPPQVKITGGHAIRTDTPMACRRRIKECIDTIFKKDADAVRAIIREFRDEYESLDLNDIATPMGCNNIRKWWTEATNTFASGTPIQVRAGCTFNYMITKHNLQDKYERIVDSDKIKFIALRKINPVGQHVIGWKTKLPPEFNLSNYIDYEKQFQKSFMKPLSDILNAIGWSAEEPSSLLDMFD